MNCCLVEFMSIFLHNILSKMSRNTTTIFVVHPFPSLPFGWRFSPEVLVLARDAKDGGSRGGHVIMIRVGKLKQYCWGFKNPCNQLMLVVNPIIYKVLYIQGGAGFFPSTVVKNLKSISILYFEQFWMQNQATLKCCPIETGQFKVFLDLFDVTAYWLDSSIRLFD